MPTYSFKDNNTGEEFDEFMGMSEKDQYLEDNPHISQVPTMFSFVGDHIMGVGPVSYTHLTLPTSDLV